jgi:hypothetical protein
MNAGQIGASLLGVLVSAVPFVQGGRVQPDCAPPPVRVPLAADLPQLAGLWTLTVVNAEHRRAELTLDLRATDSLQRVTVNIISRKPLHESRFLYIGTLDGNGRAVGLGYLAEMSLDPDQPGVRGELEPGPERFLRFRVGEESTKRRVVVLDGYSFTLSVHSVEPERMSGSWAAGVYVALSVDSGWWCATKRS